MPAASRSNSPSQRQPFPSKASPKSGISGDLIVMAALIGISRALFRPKKEGQVKRAFSGLRQTLHQSGRGRSAEKPTDIPARRWRDIAWRIYEGVQNDRVLLVAAGVTYYGLLALFPATAAIVSHYGLFADASSINEHLRLISGFLPEGALQVVGDQVKRIASQGQTTLGFTFLATLAFSLWGVNAGTKSIFDALNIIYEERKKRGFIKLTLCSLAWLIGAAQLLPPWLAQRHDGALAEAENGEDEVEPLVEPSVEEWELTFRVNIHAMFYLCKAVVRHMKPGPGTASPSFQSSNPPRPIPALPAILEVGAFTP
jgi:hypothetical protein